MTALENRIEKALKKQAEDIASDVTELEKQIRRLQTDYSNINNNTSVDKFELRRFENYILDRVDTSLGKINPIQNHKSMSPHKIGRASCRERV